MSRSSLGLLVGLILGVVLLFDDFGGMLIVALIGAVGFGIGKIIDGELDVSQLMQGRRK